MWWRKRKETKNLYDPELVEEIEVWNAHWTAPEYGDFYRWDEPKRMFVQQWEPPSVEQRIRSLERDVDAFNQGKVVALKGVKEIGEFKRGGILSAEGILNVGNVEALKGVNLGTEAKKLQKKTRELTPKVSVIPSGPPHRRSIEDMVLNARKGIDTRPLDELRAWYGWSTEFNVQLGTDEYIYVHGVRMSVGSVQYKINNRFGSMYLRVDGKFGMITANLLWSLEHSIHV